MPVEFGAHGSDGMTLGAKPYLATQRFPVWQPVKWGQYGQAAGYIGLSVRLNPPHVQAIHNDSVKFKMSGATAFAGGERWATRAELSEREML